MQQTQRHFSRFMMPGMFCGVFAAFSLQAAPGAAPGMATGLNMPWDWSGVIGTGQSLAVGQGGVPVQSTNQPWGNLKLSTGGLPWPVDPNDTNLALAPLVEPIGRLARGYPSSWPDNIAGETPHAAMANQISALVRAASGRDFIGVHGEVGENGQGMTFLKKNAVQRGVNGRSYQAALIETKAIARLAKAAGKTYGVGAIILTHGESDAGNANYENDLYNLWLDFNADLAAITGQTQKIQMILSQQNSCNDRSASTLAQWKAGVDHSAEIVCSGPKYQYPSGEGVHLTAEGYQQLGEKYGQIYFQRVVLGRNWQPLQPAAIQRDGARITVRYHVPAPPLVWETAFPAPHPSIAEWKQGKGFEVSASGGERVAIDSVSISGDAVIIACASDPGPNARVGYAMIGERARMAAPFAGTFRWGLLRDSDPFQGATSKTPQPNYGVAFEMSVP
jgi:lysophospholipase L1-like esterase